MVKNTYPVQNLREEKQLTLSLGSRSANSEFTSQSNDMSKSPGVSFVERVMLERFESEETGGGDRA